LIKTQEFSRKCQKCKWVYPSDHVDAPKKGEVQCQPCIQKENQ
jgi:hypothetical protein